MKLILALLLVVVVIVSAQRDQLNDVKTGKELIYELETLSDHTYLIFFYDHNADKGKISDYRNKAKEEILSRHKYILYYEVDVDASDFQDLITLLFPDDDKREYFITEVGHQPSFLVMHQGLGYVVHGEGSIEDIVGKLRSKEWHLEFRKQMAPATPPSDTNK